MKRNHEVAGYAFGMVGILYSVILGYMVINVNERYNEAVKTLHAEASAVADLYRDASIFPPESRDLIRADLRKYVRYVVDEEWNSTDVSHMHIQGQKILKDLWNTYFNVPVDSEKENIWYTASIEKLDKLLSARLEREFASWDRLGTLMWSMLIFGGIWTVSFMFFFGLENFRAQMLMTTILASYIIFILFLIYALDDPFHDPHAIHPYALEQVMDLLDKWNM